jgi:DNA repair exonuclease SbcCD ATPase subunit
MTFGNLSKPAWTAIAALLLALTFCGLWLHEHDARVRAAAQLGETQRAAEETVTRLEAQAKQDVEAADQQNARVVSQLESQRAALETRAQGLAAQLAALRSSEQVRQEQLASLPISQVEKQVQEWLAPAGPSGQKAEIQGQKAEGKNQAAPAPGLTLTGAGVRKVAAAIDELDSCRAESQIEGRQFSTCAEQARLDQAAIQRQSDSIAKLNQALAAKDKILAARQQESKAELKVARGTFLGRLARTLKHVAIGVGIGLVAGIALK